MSGDVEQRLRSLEVQLPKLADQDALARLEKKVSELILKEATARENEWEELTRASRVSREEQHVAVQKMLAAEKSARLAHETMLHNHLGSHETKFLSHLAESLAAFEHRLDEHTRGLNTLCGPLKQRVEHLEDFLQTSAARRDHSATIKDALNALNEKYGQLQRKVEELDGELRETSRVDRLAREEQLGSLQAMFSNEQGAWSGHAEATAQRLEEHSSRIDALQAFLLEEASDDSPGGCLRSVLQAVERRLYERLAKETDSRQADVTDLKERLSTEAAQRQADCGMLQQALTGSFADSGDVDGAASQRQKAAAFGLAGRLERLEEFVKGSTLGDARILEETLSTAEASYKAALGKEAATREAEIVDLREMLRREQFAREEFCVHERTTRAAYEEQLQARLQEHKEERTNLINDNNASLGERVEYLEAFLVDLIDEHSKGTLKDVLGMLQEQFRDNITAMGELLATEGASRAEGQKAIGDSIRAVQDRMEELDLSVRQASDKRIDVGSKDKMDFAKLLEEMLCMSSTLSMVVAERKAEEERIWEALDTHTHPVSENSAAMTNGHPPSQAAHAPATSSSKGVGVETFAFGTRQETNASVGTAAMVVAPSASVVHRSTGTLPQAAVAGAHGSVSQPQLPLANAQVVAGTSVRRLHSRGPSVTPQVPIAAAATISNSGSTPRGSIVRQGSLSPPPPTTPAPPAGAPYYGDRSAPSPVHHSMASAATSPLNSKAPSVASPVRLPGNQSPMGARPSVSAPSGARPVPEAWTGATAPAARSSIISPRAPSPSAAPFASRTSLGPALPRPSVKRQEAESVLEGALTALHSRLQKARVERPDGGATSLPGHHR
eukprot:TRINITY_DN80978_c0_g1_i1.p1 TRINITY_DN80978_c0_g1~~TRINITY_DN80978_c0_g1_i1.p1  ORF type:complete len:844 (+),score=219.52 TRINITY_DN80978_c0_g1_i1:91-2622(+)